MERNGNGVHAIVTASATQEIFAESAIAPSGARTVEVGEALTLEQQQELQVMLNAAIAQISDAEGADDLLSSPEKGLGARLQAWVGENAETRDAEAAKAANREIQFDPRDLRWGLSLYTWLKGVVRHGQVRPTGDPEEIADSVRVGLVGDWGSGLYGAPEIGRRLGEPTFDAAIHLGDVYYAGTGREIKTRFLPFWPVPRAGFVTRSLNSNHEMYSGGHGYFDTLLPALGQRSSYFALRNKEWLILALDTGYDDHDLDDEQTRWIRESVLGAGERKVVLLSHHQPFSRFEGGGGNLLIRLRPILDAKRIFAWYWGHEHHAIVFDRHATWRLYGRCIGHGGFPDLRYEGAARVQYGQANSRWRRLEPDGDLPGGILLDDPNPDVAPKADPQKYRAHGYASLEFKGPNLVERLHRPTGEVIYEYGLKP